jgi:GNAT superfamily N-acetyltransferase
MGKISFRIRRPEHGEWAEILAILETANFHRIGGREMPEFPLEDCFVAVADDHIVGVAGYRILDQISAKTTLLAVLPDYRIGKIGYALHQARQDYLKTQGVKSLTTNADDPRVVHWYQRHFGYRETGLRIPKTEDFGRVEYSEWINLCVDL